jgi:ferritin-like metal-binding protein YciE
MNTAFELFVHELRDMLNAENKLTRALTEQELESTRPDLRQAFADHRKQTEQQAVRLLDIFREIGEIPSQAECKGIAGLVEEKQEFMKHHPSRDVLDIFNVAAAIKVERYEISAYESLILLAHQLRLINAVQKLDQSLIEEQQTLEEMRNFSREFQIRELGYKPLGQQIEGGLPRKAA